MTPLEQAFITAQRRAEATALRHDADQIFLGTVAALSGNRAQIIRNGQTQADGQFYATSITLAGLLSVGDTVIVHRVGGGYYVADKQVS